MPLSNPQPMGDMLSQKDVLGHVLIVAPTEFIDHIPTVNTKPGEKSPAIRVDVIDFGNGDGTINPDSPVVYKDVLWFGVMSGALRRSIGDFIAARMGQGQASPGRNAPWQLDSMETETDWMAFMNNVLDGTPLGTQFQTEAIEKANKASQAAQVAQAQQTAAPAAPQAPAAPMQQSGPPAAPPANRPPAPPVSAPAPAASAPAAAPAGDLMASLSGLPPEELAKVMATLAQQNQAAH